MPTWTYWTPVVFISRSVRHQRLITAEVVRDYTVGDEGILDAWQGDHEVEISRFNRVVSEIKDAPQINLAMISVALRELEKIIHL